jgi:hypothetical protein
MIFKYGFLDHDGISSNLFLMIGHIHADLKLNSGDDRAELTSRGHQG